MDSSSSNAIPTTVDEQDNWLTEKKHQFMDFANVCQQLLREKRELQKDVTELRKQNAALQADNTALNTENKSLKKELEKLKKAK